jgi:hypothetical protein
MSNKNDKIDDYVNEEEEAYKEGVVAAISEKGYSEFAVMLGGDAEKNIKQKEADYGDVTGIGDRVVFDLGANRDAAAWTKLFLLQMSQVVPEELKKKDTTH